MMPEAKPILERVNLRKSFGTVEILKGISLEVRPSELIFIIGPSGSGKSTLLLCCNRIEEPTSGSVLVEGVDSARPGVDLNRIRQKIGMVFQRFSEVGRAATSSARHCDAGSSRARSPTLRSSREASLEWSSFLWNALRLFFLSAHFRISLSLATSR
jgi:ABC-type phosphate transport system ATPase subunit